MKAGGQKRRREGPEEGDEGEKKRAKTLKVRGANRRKEKGLGEVAKGAERTLKGAEEEGGRNIDRRAKRFECNLCILPPGPNSIFTRRASCKL